jgi:uncharacterized protein
VRAVLDVNVLISAPLSRHGAPARILNAWLDGAFELVLSELLIAELRRALAYPKLRLRIQQPEGDEFVEVLLRGAVVAADPTDPPPFSSADPDDDYLIALAASTGAILVSGDGHLLEFADRAPIHAPSEFAEMLNVV